MSKFRTPAQSVDDLIAEAHRARSRLAIAMAGRVMGAIASGVLRIWRFVRPLRHRGRLQRQAAAAELAALNDHLLRDIGLHRDQIVVVVQRLDAIEGGRVSDAVARLRRLIPKAA